MGLKQYKKKDQQIVIGVQLMLDTEGFDYKKWGSSQHCKAGDWLVNNAGECYTVDQESFEQTYREIGQGQYIKTAPVWAEQVNTAGFVETKEGKTAYQAGDYIACNNEDGTDSYAISQEKFEQTYTKK